MNTWQIIFALMMGFSLAATCGLRAFLPLLIIAIGAKAGVVHLSQSFDWMQSWPALICFGSATVLEIAGDKIPAVDHVLDSVGTFIRPIAGALAATSLIRGFDPLTTLVVGTVLGSSIAGVTHALKATTRLASTALTAGLGNFFLSAIEDGLAIFTGIVGLILPYLTAAIILTLLVLGVRATIRKMKSRARLE